MRATPEMLKWNVQSKLYVLKNEGGREAIDVKDCADDKKRNVPIYGLKGTERLVRPAAEKLILQDMLTDFQIKTEVLLDYRNDKRRFFMSNF